MDTPDCCAPGSQTMDSDVAARVAAVLKSLADPLRLRMLSLISTTPGGEACVCDIATVADVSQPTVSHHLKVLKDTGVLTAERRGTWVYYRVAPDLAEPVAQLLDGFAPAVVRAGQAEPEGRIGTGAGVDAALTRIATEITGQVRGIGPDLVLHTVRESYAALARTSRAGTDVVALAARFAHQRLEDLRRVAERAVDDPSTGTVSPGVPQVLFVCVANDGRSQIAAALATRYVSDALIVRSAGLRPPPCLAPSVEELLGGLGGGAATRTPAGPLAPAAFPKPLTDDALRAADVVVTLGCGDACPVLPGVRYEDWIVGDPALASRAGVRAIAAHLDRRVRDLLAGLLPSADLPAALFPDAVSSTEQHLLRPVDPAPGRG